MTKLIIILLLIFGLILLGLSMAIKSVKRFFIGFMPNQDQMNKAKKRNEKEKVIYNKDDVVVLKGEAQDKEKNGKKFV